MQDGEYAVHIAVRVEKGLEKLRLLLQSRANRNAARVVGAWLEFYYCEFLESGVHAHSASTLVQVCDPY